MSELTREQINASKEVGVAWCTEAKFEALCNMAISALDVRERCAQFLDDEATERLAIASRGDEGAAYEADWTRSLARKLRALDLDLGAQDQRGAAVQDADQALSELGEPTPREATSLEGNPANRVGHLAVERSDRSSQEQALNPPSVQPAPHPLTAKDESPSPAPARGLSAVEEWPESLMLRDTKLHDDLGGGGQRIFTTAGQGYKKEKYVRATELDRLRAERYETQGEIVNLQAHLLALGQDSYSALYGWNITDGKTETGEPFGIEEAVAAIREEQKRGREASVQWSEVQVELSRLRQENMKLRSEREGMVLVPREPTQAMIWAAQSTALRSMDAREIYRAMLAAGRKP